MNITKVLVAMVIGWALATLPLRAQANLSEAREVRAAVLQFLTAIETGDAATLNRIIWVAEDLLPHDRLHVKLKKIQEAARKVWIDLIVAEKQLERIALQRFGEEGKRLGMGLDYLFPASDRKSLERARVEIPEDQKRMALVYKPGDVSPIRLYCSEEGVWQIQLDLIGWVSEFIDSVPMNYSDDDIRVPLLDRMKEMVAAVNAVATKIEKAELSSIETAEAELGKSLADIAEAARQSRIQNRSRAR